MKLLWALLGLLPLSTAYAACAHYGPPDISLTGRVVRGALQTAPGYHAQHHINSDYYWSIKTVAPFCLSANANLGDMFINGAHEAQLWPSSATIMERIGQLNGVAVQVTGHFMPTQIPHYHPYSIFVVSAIHASHTIDP